jgi:hypothetical protein
MNNYVANDAEQAANDSRDRDCQQHQEEHLDALARFSREPGPRALSDSVNPKR